MANKGRNPQDEEISLWARMTKGIKAWHKDSDVSRVTSSNKAADNGQPASSVMDIPIQIKHPNTPTTGANGLDRRTMDKLTKGKMSIEGRIDLHGKTQSQAQSDLTTFIANAYHAQKRCVLVVTGKGSRAIDDKGIVSERSERGILRTRVPEWIYSPPLSTMVLSHSSAIPRDGGGGAFYIYLKNSNKN